MLRMADLRTCSAATRFELSTESAQPSAASSSCTSRAQSFPFRSSPMTNETAAPGFRS
jgi:hypothetical protein